MFGAIEANGDGHDLGENGDFRRQIVGDAHEKAAGDDVHVLRPSAEKMRRVGGAEIVAIVGHVLAEVIREIVTAVIAIAAGDVGADYDAISDLERDAFEVAVVAVSADGGYGSNVFVALDNGETDVLAFVVYPW